MEEWKGKMGITGFGAEKLKEADNASEISIDYRVKIRR